MMTPRPDHFTYPADKARGGQIALTKPWMRVVFLGGLIGGFIIALALALAAAIV
jgi:hypothetical protein